MQMSALLWHHHQQTQCQNVFFSFSHQKLGENWWKSRFPLFFLFWLLANCFFSGGWRRPSTGAVREPRWGRSRQDNPSPISDGNAWKFWKCLKMLEMLENARKCDERLENTENVKEQSWRRSLQATIHLPSMFKTLQILKNCLQGQVGLKQL